MSQIPDFSKLSKMAEEILGGKEYFISTVLGRINEAAEAFPHDQAIKTAGRVLEKRASSQGSLATISQRDFQKIYDDVCGLGNKTAFREYLDEYLLVRAASPVAHRNEDFASGLRDSGSEMDLVDADIAASLNGLFGEPVVARKGSFIDNGRRGLEFELASLGFANPSVSVVAQNNDFVIYAADIQSTNGRIPAYIPAEIKMGTVLMPSVFVSGGEFADLTKDNLMIHAQSVAMGKKTARADQILSALTLKAEVSAGFVAEAGSDDNEVSLHSPSLYQSQIEVESANDFGMAMPDVAVPAALEHLTEGMIRDTLMESGLSFDRSVVTAAKNIVASEIRSMGIMLDKVAVDSEFDGGIMLVANIRGTGGKKTIQVPVEITAGKIHMPSVFTSGVLVDSFESTALRSFANQKIEGIFNAAFSDKFGWNYKQLHNHALKNAAFGNFVEVEDALAVISDQFGPELHRSAFEDLSGLLNVGVADEEKPLDAMDRYMKEAIAKAADKESNIKMSSSLMYLYPED